jgi:hypothetical protein
MVGLLAIVDDVGLERVALACRGALAAGALDARAVAVKMSATAKRPQRPATPREPVAGRHRARISTRRAASRHDAERYARRRLIVHRPSRSSTAERDIVTASGRRTERSTSNGYLDAGA